MTTKTKTETNNGIWTIYRVQWDFITQLCGSVPSSKDLVDDWVNARKPKAQPPGTKTIDEIQEEVFETLDNAEEPSYSKLVFQRNERGEIVMRAATVRAHIKDCARVISGQYVGKIQGERSFATRIINGVYVDEEQYWIPVTTQDAKPVPMKNAMSRDKAVHVKGPRGTMNALKSFEYVEGARMRFRLKVLGKSASLKDLETLFMYGGVHGYAGERGDGEGKYRFTIEAE
jgi:archaellum component FlaF (FlaF/FlaG flagellin family)